MDANEMTQKGVTMNFSIDSLKILKGCDKSLYKNLKLEEEYFFNARHRDSQGKKCSLISKIPDFWGENINVQAIVGKNGSGKSTLMDLMYMAINNFAYMFERDIKRPNADFLFYVKGLHVRICYTFDEWKGILNVKGDEIELKIYSEKNEYQNYDTVKRIFKISDKIIEADVPRKSNSEIKKIVEPFFYTVVSNYSLQSFISSNYRHKVYAFNRSSKESDSPRNIDEDGYDKRITKKEGVKDKSWIDSIFHKNDGYVRSIVLNPFRDKGKIDMEVEKKISNYRLISLLIDSKENGLSIIPNYTLKQIDYKLNEEYVKNKLNFCTSINEIVNFFENGDYKSIEKEIREIEGNIKERDKKKQSTKYFNRIKEKLKCKLQYLKLYNSINHKYDFHLFTSKSTTLALVYLIYKIDKMVYGYPLFKEYRATGTRSLYNPDYDNFDSFLKFIESNHSHAVSKVKQTIHFLQNAKHITGNYFDDFLKKFDRKFTYDDYKKRMKNSFRSLDEIIEQLPPPFFSYNVFLENTEAKKIPLNEMSSGELQFLSTLSTHAYHARNLMSINDAEIKYKNVNLVFDEVEVCFHPEYQRIFIKKLTDMLKKMAKDDFRFNVFIITHSPFILSDIPQENILYLEEGAVANEKIKKNPFAANVNDILHQSFFMDNGFTGEFAKQKINSIINSCEKWTKVDAISFVDEFVGEPIVKACLKRLIEEKY